jgi:hypothetical protein
MSIRRALLEPDEVRRQRPSWRTMAVVAPLVLCVVIWVWLVLTLGQVTYGPRANYFGGDFALNYSSAEALSHGRNPYDGRVLLQTERTFLGRQGVPVEAGASVLPLTWGGYPPLFFWLLNPLTRVPFRTVALTWTVALIALLEIAFLSLLNFLGWRRRVVPALIFLCMPQTTLLAYYGNISAFVFTVIVVSLALQRRHPLAAGLVLSLAWLKPQLALPSFLLIALFHTAARRQFVLGMLGGATSLAVLMLVATGPQTVGFWIRGLSSVSSVAGQQPNMAPLVGLYAGWAPPVIRSALQIALVALTLGLTLQSWRKLRNVGNVPIQAVAWLWVVWFLAIPYAHFADEVIMVIPLLLLLGRDGQNVHRLVPAAALYVSFFSVLLFSAKPFHIQLLSLPLLGLAVVFHRMAPHQLRPSWRAGVLPRPDTARLQVRWSDRPGHEFVPRRRSDVVRQPAPEW